MTPSNIQDVSIDLLDVAVSHPIPTAQGATRTRLFEIHLSARSLLVVVFLVLIFTGAARQIVDPDFWWHLRTGQHLLATRTIPHTDLFSAVFAGKDWITHEWLSEVFIYSVYRTIGYGGLTVSFALLITAGFAVAYRRCTRTVGHVYVSGAALLLGALTAAPTWGVRPQVFSFLFASIFLYLLECYQRGERKHSIWWTVPLMILWVNVHAGFAVGLALIGLAIVGMALDAVLLERDSLAALWRKVRTLCLVLPVCGAAVVLNPNGPRMYSYPLETLTSQAMMRYIEEWRSPNFHELMFQPLALLILAVFGALIFSGKRVRFSQLLLLLATTWATLRSGRNVPFFALVAMPLLAEHSWHWLTSQPWGRWLTKPESREVGANATVKILLNVLLLVVAPITLAAVRVQRTVTSQAAAEAQHFPAAAMEFIRAQQLPQPLYNEYGWGGYLIWKLHPDYRVFIDGRADVYGDEFIEEFLATHDGEAHWQESLNKYGVRTVLIKPDAALASLLRQSPSWQKVFEDREAIIFVKRQ